MYTRGWGKNILEKYDKDAFIKLYNENSVTNLAKMLKVSRATVIAMAKKYSLPHKKNGGDIRRHKAIKIDIKELEHLYRTTKTKDLAKRFRVSITTLVKIIKENGIKVKEKGFSVRDRKIIVEE